MALDNYKITQSDISAVNVEGVQGDSLRGSVTENKRVFDRYPNMITGKFNSLCDYIGTQAPEGDTAINYTSTEIAFICNTLNCTESSITL